MSSLWHIQFLFQMKSHNTRLLLWNILGTGTNIGSKVNGTKPYSRLIQKWAKTWSIVDLRWAEWNLVAEQPLKLATPLIVRNFRPLYNLNRWVITQKITPHTVVMKVKLSFRDQTIVVPGCKHVYFCCKVWCFNMGLNGNWLTLELEELQCWHFIYQSLSLLGWSLCDVSVQALFSTPPSFHGCSIETALSWCILCLKRKVFILAMCHGFFHSWHSVRHYQWK